MIRLSRARSERGAVFVFVAGVMVVLILVSGLAVDLGRQRALRRSLQADADVIALDLVRLIEPTSTAAYLDSIVLGHLNASRSRNGLPDAGGFTDLDVHGVTVEWGRLSGGEFTVAEFDLNAVRVTLTEDIQYLYLGRSSSATRSAVAAVGGEDLAGFSIGSFGANLNPNQAGLLNDLLTPLLGNPVGLDALSYEGLVGADLNVGLLATELGLDALTPNEVLTEQLEVADLMLAAATVLQRDGNSAAADLLCGPGWAPGQDCVLTTEMENLPPITLGDIVNVAAGAEDSALGADINALDLLQTAVFLSQCAPGATDVAECSGLAIPALDTDLGILSTNGSIRVIQSPRHHYGPVNTGTNTSQTAVNLGIELGAIEVGQCVPRLSNLYCALNALGGLIVGTVDAQVSVDATITLADGRATIGDIDCSDPEALVLGLGTDSSLYDLDLTISVKFGQRGVLGGVLGPLLGELTLQASSERENEPDSVSFTVAPDVLSETIKSTGAGDVGLASLNLVTQDGDGVLGLLGSLGINNALTPVLNLAVNPLLGVLDTQVLGPLTDLLGLNVVGADLTAEAIDCNMSGIALVG